MTTCALNPASPYISGWLGVNIVVVLMGFAIIALVYTVGRFLPTETREKINGVTKLEIAQLMISMLIIFILLVLTSTAYSISCNVASSLAGGSSSITFSDPFQFATTYIGNLSFGVGLNLYSQVVLASYQMVVTSSIWQQVPQVICNLLKSLSSGSLALVGKFFVCNLSTKPPGASGISVGFTLGYDVYIIYDSLSFLYLEIFGPIIALAIASLFLQYLAIPVIQYMAFGVALPAALIMRSLPFSGPSLRSTANIVLAVAISLYLIYPLTITFDAWALHWIFSSTNPLFAYITVIPNSNFNAPASYLQVTPSDQSFFGVAIPSLVSAFKTIYFGVSIGSSTIAILPATVAKQGVTFAAEIAQYAFEAIVLFGINIAITIGFAASLADALTRGVEGNAAFWSNL
jgi:hypothetical protein